MKASLKCTLLLSAALVTAFTAAGRGFAGAQALHGAAGRCDTHPPLDPAAMPPPEAPPTHARGHVYGTPIATPILKRRHKQPATHLKKTVATS
jgi:hypothetical protein